jgi:hypothetical protein
MPGRILFGILGGSIADSPVVQLNESLVVASDRCWLCGVFFTSKNPSSNDHVVVSWLQSELGIRDERLTLQNRSHIPFRQARINSCKSCNTNHLSKLENRVAKAYRDGLTSFQALAPEDLFVWLGKMHYGLLRLELRLRLDRKSGSPDTILKPEFFVGSLRLEHLLLQSARGVLRFRQQPASVLFFELEPPKGFPFGYTDDINPAYLALRVGTIGIVANLLDWGWLQELWPQVPLSRTSAPLSEEEFLLRIAASRSLARRLQGAPDVVVGEEADGTLTVDVVAEVNAGVAAAARGVRLPPGYRPELNQWCELPSAEEFERELSELRRQRWGHLGEPPRGGGARP